MFPYPWFAPLSSVLRWVIVLGSTLLLTATAIKLFTRRRSLISKSVATLIREERRRQLGLGKPSFYWLLGRERLGNWRKAAAAPTPVAVVVTVMLTLIAAAVQVLFRSASIQPLPESDFATVLTTLWQAHMALAGLALPILVFIIEVARDDASGFAPTSEVLIRRTLAFPIIAFVLLSSGVFAVGSYWLRAKSTYLVGLVVFGCAVAVTLFAYYRVLSLLFRRSLLKRASKELLKERFTASIDRHARIRIGANVFAKAIADLGIQYSALAKERNDRFLTLDAPRSGYVVDVNVQLLREFLRLLPWKSGIAVRSGVQPAGIPIPSSIHRPDVPAIGVLRLYGERVYEADRGLVVLRRDAFGELPKRELEERIGRVFMIGESLP